MKYIVLSILLLMSGCKITPYSGSDEQKQKAQWPQDDAAHYKNSLEWWYFTGHLKDKDSSDEYGVEYVFFHFTPRGKKDFLMVNTAITDPNDEKFYYQYKIDRLKELQDTSLPIDLRIEKKKDLWQLTGEAGEYHMVADMPDEDISLDLRTSIDKPVLLHNGTGYENYGDYTTAGYVSYTRLNVEGKIKVEEDTLDVEGEMWYDRQWNCIGVFTQEVAWDWFSIQFEDDEELMIYQLYNVIDSTTLYGGAYFTENNERIDITNVELTPLEYWKSDESNIDYPVKWRVQVPKQGIDVNVEAVIPEQELKINFGPFTALYYWEGMCSVAGEKKGKQVKGNSYIEMTNRRLKSK